MLPFVIDLDAAAATNSALAGSKAATLATLRQAGFPVPPGFVVPTEVFRIAPHGEITPDVEAAIAAAYSALGPQALVAVRSSAAQNDGADASVSGQFQSFLGLGGVAKIVRHIERCWQSVTGPRAQAYYHHAGIEADQVAMAVLVQLLVDSDASGIIIVPHSANPAAEIQIEASWGLGEAVVSGEVSPDLYRVDAASEQVLERQISAKHSAVRVGPKGTVAVPLSAEQQTAPVLSAAQVGELVRLGKQVAEHCGAAQQVEWALKDNQWWIVQARPVTA